MDVNFQQTASDVESDAHEAMSHERYRVIYQFNDLTGREVESLYNKWTNGIK